MTRLGLLPISAPTRVEIDTFDALPAYRASTATIETLASTVALIRSTAFLRLLRSAR